MRNSAKTLRLWPRETWQNLSHAPTKVRPVLSGYAKRMKMEVLFFHAVRHVTGRVTSGSRLTGPDRRNSIYQDACYASDETWNHPGGLKEEFSVGAAIFAHEFRAAG